MRDRLACAGTRLVRENDDTGEAAVAREIHDGAVRVGRRGTRRHPILLEERLVSEYHVMIGDPSLDAASWNGFERGGFGQDELSLGRPLHDRLGEGMRGPPIERRR